MLHIAMTERWMARFRALGVLAVCALGGLAWPVPEATATIIPANSCSDQDVRNAINTAQDGDTVTVPAGTCTWTVSINITAGIVLQGAGVGNTIIIDRVPDAAVVLKTVAGKMYRVTGFTFQASEIRKLSGAEIILVIGETTTFRIDHNTFDSTVCAPRAPRAIRVAKRALGVIDHNSMIGRGLCGAVYVTHATWGGGTNDYGDGSWAEDSYWGTDKFVFIEDNVFQAAPGYAMFVTDGSHGGRFVFRYNQVTNSPPTAPRVVAAREAPAR
jgi:hypothetical protein